jgi:hypothetical protein
MTDLTGLTIGTLLQPPPTARPRIPGYKKPASVSAAGFWSISGIDPL